MLFTETDQPYIDYLAEVYIDHQDATPCNADRGWVGTTKKSGGRGCKRKKGTAARVARVKAKRAAKSKNKAVSPDDRGVRAKLKKSVKLSPRDQVDKAVINSFEATKGKAKKDLTVKFLADQVESGGFAKEAGSRSHQFSAAMELARIAGNQQELLDELDKRGKARVKKKTQKLSQREIIKRANSGEYLSNGQPEGSNTLKDRVGNASKYSKGKPIKTQEQFSLVAKSAISDLAKHSGDDLVEIAALRESIGNRVSESDFTKFMRGIHSSGSHRLVGGAAEPSSRYSRNQLISKGVESTLGGQRFYIKEETL